MKIINTYTRIYCSDIDRVLNYYEELTGEKCSIRFSYSEMNLELAQIGSFIILAGTEKNLQPFRNTVATLVVDSVEEFRQFILDNGGKVIRDIKKVPTGLNLTMQNPDGSVMEYVQFKN